MFLEFCMTFLSLVGGGNNYESMDKDTDETSTPAVAVAVVAPNNSKVIYDSPRAAKTQPGAERQPDYSGGALYSNTETIQRRWDQSQLHK